MFLATRGYSERAIAIADREQDPDARAHALLGTAQGILDKMALDAKAHRELLP
jgi:hypothetical protein